MLKVLVHKPSKNLQDCELTYLESEKIDYEKALNQHEDYCQMIKQCGAQLEVLDENINLADSVFVEDPIIVFDELAVLTSMGVESRRAESDLLEKYFKEKKEVKKIQLPSKIEGGDVLIINKKVYVGVSARTNIEAINELESILKPFEYEVKAVKVHGCLHLKTGCTALDENTILINPNWVDASAFEDYKLINIPSEEPFAANIMKINDFICMNECFPKTIDLVKSLNYKVKTTNISEFVKAEAGLTCMSVRYK